MRKDLWGYASDEKFTNDKLIAEAYTGIRPAPGYPSCPEHTIKKAMFELMDCQEIGMYVTEALAIWPAASVSGFYFSHPHSEYFVNWVTCTRSAPAVRARSRRASRMSG